MDNQIQLLSPFGTEIAPSPATEGIKYAGSKTKIIPHILALTKSVKAKTVFDGFSGTTRVSQAFAKSHYSVICNDIAVWSKLFATCYLLNDKGEHHYRELIAHLNDASPFDGWFTKHYGGYDVDGLSVGQFGNKTPWQIHNTRKLDGIRTEIEKLNLNDLERSVAITSLILALDKVDNTIGHYASYLKRWSPRSYNSINLQVPSLFNSENEHRVYQKDVFDLISEIEVDLAYLDPPYGSNNEKMPPSRVRYAAYYHLWNSVCRFDKPALFGKANRRTDSRDYKASSVFEEFRRNSNGRFVAVEAISKLIELTNAKWVILSYSSGGRATAHELSDVMNRNGKLREIIEIDHRKNVMADMRWTNEWSRDTGVANKEFLFLLEKY